MSAGASNARGPASGVVATAKSPSATAQQVSGAVASCSAIRQREPEAGDRVCMCTLTTASAIPMPNQVRKPGSQLPSRPERLPTAPTTAAHPRATAGSTTSRPRLRPPNQGRRRPRTAAASNGSAR